MNLDSEGKLKERPSVLSSSFYTISATSVQDSLEPEIVIGPLDRLSTSRKKCTCMDSDHHFNEAPVRERRHGAHFPRMTGYRILTVALTAGFGSYKAKLSYEGYSTAPNTLDWLYGVVVFLMWVLFYAKVAARTSDLTSSHLFLQTVLARNI